MGSTILSRSFYYGQLRAAYNRLAQGEGGRKLGLPTWSWERERVGPISAETVFAQIESRAAAAEPGDAIVAHLLMPHDPYAYTAKCQLRSPSTWLGRSMFNQYTAITPSVRALHYDRYIAQVHCLYRQLESLMEAVESSQYSDRFVIILHGDHGARLGLRYPKHGSGSVMTAVDYRDNYATLFAVRAKGVNAIYRSDVRSVQELFGTFVRNDFDSSALDRQYVDAPYVYITSRNRAIFPIERCLMSGYSRTPPAIVPAPTGPESGLEDVGKNAAPAQPNANCQTISHWQAAHPRGAGHNLGNQALVKGVEAVRP